MEERTIRFLPTEFSPEFVQGMANRMAVSCARYGPIAEGFPEPFDALQSARLRLERYSQTGNQEWLLDAANFLMIEFLRPRHPAAHFRATSDQESPGRVREGRTTLEANTSSLENRRRGGSAFKTAGGFYSREGD
jgi:hypothetical protein